VQAVPVIPTRPTPGAAVTVARLRVAGAVAASLIAGLAAHRYAFPDALASFRLPSDPQAAWVRRASAWRDLVPPQGTVGYLSRAHPWSDTLVPPFDTGVVQALVRYKLVQYALAPTLVMRGAAFPIVVGDFSGALGDTVDLPKEGWSVVGNAGDGLLLLERRGGP